MKRPWLLFFGWGVLTLKTLHVGVVCIQHLSEPRLSGKYINTRWPNRRRWQINPWINSSAGQKTRIVVAPFHVLQSFFPSGGIRESTLLPLGFFSSPWRKLSARTRRNRSGRTSRYGTDTKGFVRRTRRRTEMVTA